MLSIYLFAVDFFLITLGFFFAYWLRFKGDIPEYNFFSLRESIIFIVIINLCALGFFRVYRQRSKSLWDLFKKTLSGLFFGTLFSLSFIYAFRARWLSFPTTVFIISWPLNLMLVFLFNGLVLEKRGKIKKKVLAIGKEKFDYNLERGVELKRIDSEDITRLFKDKEIDEIIICERIKDGEKLNFLLFFSQLLKVNIVFSPQLYSELVSDKIYDNIPLASLSTFVGSKSDWEEFIIRIFDVAASFIILFICLPLILLVAILIKVSSWGKIFYRQERVGKDGKTFVLYKFRTMVSDAERKQGPVLAVRNDPRVTKIGRFLRFSRIDEIPQFFNVIRGNMSLVGPRPERMHFVKMHDALQGIRLAVKPGLTGIAQIRSFYDLKPNHKQKYDYFYIQKRSLALNLYILFKTIFVIFDRRKGW